MEKETMPSSTGRKLIAKRLPRKSEPTTAEDRIKATQAEPLHDGCLLYTSLLPSSRR